MRARVVGVGILVLILAILATVFVPRARRAAAEGEALELALGVDNRALARLGAPALARICSVWGFVKYHHPAAARGRVDMDVEFVRLLARASAPETPPVNEVLAQWIDGLGPLRSHARSPATSADPHLAPDIGWIHDRAVLGEPLAARLEQVHAARASGRHHYIGFSFGVGKPEFRNEHAFETRDAPPPALRLLGLARFWNMIAYYFPYRDLIDEDWPSVLEAFTPEFLSAATRPDYERTLVRLLACAHDTHCNLWGHLANTPPTGACDVDVSLRFVERRLVVDAVGDTSRGGLEVGDEVLALDGVPVDSLVPRWSPYYPASNEAARLRDVAARFLHGPCAAARVLVDRDGRQLALTVSRAALGRRPERWHFDRGAAPLQRLSPDVAYLSLAHVRKSDVGRYLDRAKGTKGMVIDLRNYPSDFLVFSLGSHLVRRATPFARFTRATPGSPGAFEWTAPVHLNATLSSYAGRIVILVDETTQSSAEYHALAFRAVPGAIVVGSTTAGADGNISTIPLPGGLRTCISGIGVFRPDRRPTQRVGIVPDIEARPTVAGIRAGRDEVLERGLRELVGADAARRIVEARATH